MNNNLSNNEELDKQIDVEDEKETLEQLTQELIQVFNFENLDKSSANKIESLLQRVLKLGGDDYTYEDFVRIL